MKLIGVSGLAGAGKDEVARILVDERNFCRVALADPLKRACAEWFGWSERQLWGESSMRNAPDVNWDGLTPRRALQELGTEYGRSMHPDVWVRKALHIYSELKRTPCAHYFPNIGLDYDYGGTNRYQGVVVPDVRFQNEVEAVRAAGGVVWRVIRTGAGLKGAAGNHSSEASIDGSHCDRLIFNDGTLEDLRARVLEACEQ